MDKTQLAVSIFDTHASAYQDKYMDVAKYEASLDLFCKDIPRQQADILEIGCGPGNITRYLLEQRPDFQLLATELSPAMLKLTAQNNPRAQVQLLDCRAITSLPTTFDALMAGFCLPYLSKEEALQLLADSATVLKPGGVLYLSTMEANYNKSGLHSKGDDQLYIYYHEADYLTTALKEYGFEIIVLQRQDYQVLVKK